MRKIFFLTLLLLSPPAFALEAATPVKLEISEVELQNICPQPIWNATLSWGGVQDTVGDRLIGDQESKKGSQYVTSEPPLHEILNQKIRRLFEICGIRFVSASEDVPSLEISIEEFYAGVKKKTLSGKAHASSRLIFTKKYSHNTSTMVEMGVELDSKRVKRKSIRQLTDVLNQLLKETLIQIPKIKQLRDLLS